jgi:hypothetical protein
VWQKVEFCCQELGIFFFQLFLDHSSTSEVFLGVFLTRQHHRRLEIGRLFTTTPLVSQDTYS